ncbi:MAG: diguanylate cyclase [Desulfuromonadaceae bacterium]|nr:diguanylate cyclase [Desulfuromonadaceae bacterium]MDD2854554.1 diguanylate cyclase [Desulfuromonadaceae bacterium]
MHADILVSTLMTINLSSTTSNAELSSVIQNMIDNRHSCMIVVENDVPIGIITERDIVRLMGLFISEKPKTMLKVSDVMSVPVSTISENTTLFEALVISSAQKIRHLPVVSPTGKLLGLVTQSDLAKAHFRIYERQRDIIEESVTERTQELLLANKQLKSLSLIDALTGLGNRRAMEVDLEHTHSQAMRYNRSYSVALYDVDEFKLYNDSYGHKKGDEALRLVSDHLIKNIRTCDRLYRYGGEEILLIMPETTLYGALILADRILASLAELSVPHEKSEHGVLTLSCGVASQIEINGYDNWEGLVDLADRGLYASKKSGRNRATIIPPEDAVDESVPRMHGNDK